jgi:hypothetical protein
MMDSSSTATHKLKLLKQFFSLCAVPYWNSLSKAAIQSQTIVVFKKGVDQDWANAEYRLTWDAKP